MKGKNMTGKMQRILFIMAAAAVLSLSGCKKLGNFYFSTSLTESYMAAAKESNLTVKETNLIFMDYQNRYNTYYSQAGMENFWDSSVEGTTFSNYLKETRLKEEICILLLLNDMAKQEDIILEEDEIAACQAAAEEYYNGLSDLEREFCHAQVSDVAKLYQKYLLAQRMIEELTKEAYLEISDNDKRIITIQLICMDRKEQAEAVWEEVIGGADFLQAAKEESILSKVEYQISRGELHSMLEEVAFYLEDGEISEIIEIDGTYYIIKCIDDFDEELSMANEENIYRQTLYNEWYPAVEEYAKSCTISFKEKLWKNLTFYETDAMTSDNLYDIYNQYFEAVRS